MRNLDITIPTQSSLYAHGTMSSGPKERSFDEFTARLPETTFLASYVPSGGGWYARRPVAQLPSLARLSGYGSAGRPAETSRSCPGRLHLSVDGVVARGWLL